MSWTTARKRLSAKEVPFLVTLLVAWAGWAVGHIVDRVIQSPTVEYSVDVETRDGKKHVTVSLENLSNHAFYGLKFEIQGPGMIPCEVSLQNKSPAWPWNGAPVVGTSGVTFDVVQLHPGWKISICAKSDQQVEPKFFLRESKSGDQSEKQAVQLVTPSLETFIARYELWLMIALALVASLAAAFWLFFSERVE